LGDAKSPQFFWMGSPPRVDEDATVIAIGAQGVSCPGGNPDEHRRRPSISAVDQENDDIIVEIEDLPEGRPLASGAVIPKPGPRGGVYVKPSEPSVFYGRGPNRYRCRVK
jgi:hypothetical protein